MAVGVMLILVGWFLAGGRALNKSLFVVNILLAGVLPSSFISQKLLGYYPRPMPPFHKLPILLFAAAYICICGIAIYITVIHKRKEDY